MRHNRFRTNALRVFYERRRGDFRLISPLHRWVGIGGQPPPIIELDAAVAAVMELPAREHALQEIEEAIVGQVRAVPVPLADPV